MSKPESVPQSGSQPVSQTPAAGTNSDGNRSAAAPDQRQAQQDRDYYNKTQNVANDRRQVEQQRDEVARREAALNYPQGSPQVPYGQPQAPAYGQPGYPQGYPQGAVPYGQPAYPMPTPPAQPDYSALVGQFGYEGAQAIVQSINQSAQPLVQNLMIQSQQLQESQRAALEAQISARGQEAYGAEWREIKQPVMNLIQQYGLPLDVAYKAISADRMRQQAVDQTYQNINRKTESNVEAQHAQPTPSAEPEINSFADAFNAAWSQYSQG